jgi:putative YhbY family RNA-binding protein
MRTLTSGERRTLRAKAHHLHPVVAIGAHGLTRSVLHEIDLNLKAHELIKVRVFDDDRDAREQLLAQICAELDAAPVQHLGKILMLWRPSPEPAPKLEKSRRSGASTPSTAKGGTSGASGSRRRASARRPRQAAAGNARRRQV